MILYICSKQLAPIRGNRTFCNLKEGETAENVNHALCEMVELYEKYKKEAGN